MQTSMERGEILRLSVPDKHKTEYKVKEGEDFKLKSCFTPTLLVKSLE